MLTFKRQPAEKSENPKVAIKSPTGSSYCGLLLLHLPSICFSIALIGLNAKQIFWLDIDAPDVNAKFNGLLFASKIHEILVTISLSSIVLDFCRNQLVGNGLPFSLILYPFQINSLPLHLRSQLWSLFRYRPWSLCTRLAAIAFILCAFISITAVSPLSAVLVLPKIGYWDTAAPGNKIYTVDMYPDSLLWPSSINASLIPQRCFDNQKNASDFVCPYAGLNTTHEITRRGGDDMGGSYNVSMTDFEHSVRPLTAKFYTMKNPGCSYTTTDKCDNYYLHFSSATTQSLKVMSDLAWLAAYGPPLFQETYTKNDLITLKDGPRSRIWQPLVQTTCLDATWTLPPHSNDKSNVPFPNRISNGVLLSLPEVYNVWAEVRPNVSFELVDDHEVPSTGIHWLKLNSQGNRGRIGAIFAQPFPPLRSTAYLTCTLDAYWIPTELWGFANPGGMGSTQIYSRFPSPNAADTLSVKEAEGRALDIEIDWLEATVGSNFSFVGLSPELIAPSLSLAVSDGLARLRSDRGIIAYGGTKLLEEHGAGTSSLCWELPNVKSDELCEDLFPEISSYADQTLENVWKTHPNSTVFSVGFQRQGYSWSMQGLLAKIAVAVFGSQICLSLIYLIFSFVGGRPRIVAWGSPEEVLTLALCTDTFDKSQSDLIKLRSAIGTPVSFGQESTERVKENSQRVEMTLLGGDDEANEIVQRNSLRNTSAGISTRQSWLLRAKIREVVDQDRLELIINNPVLGNLDSEPTEWTRACKDKKYA